jgi:hypothetical protein
MFDGGWISFTNNGDVLYASDDIIKAMRSWGFSDIKMLAHSTKSSSFPYSIIEKRSLRKELSNKTDKRLIHSQN